MSLVLAKRTKFLQDELNDNIQKQADEAEKQKVVLEETVQERTSELREKSTMMEGSLISLRSIFHHRFMRHCLQERLTQRLQPEEESLRFFLVI